MPPEFLRAAAHPVRWQLLSLLAGSDRQVHELTSLTGQQQSLVSYHLGLLRKASLVRSRRSTADGRDTYYLLDLARCAALLSAAGGSLHPALRLAGPTLPGVVPPASVLFLCTGNSARSQMAEALMRTLSGGTVDARSAGSRPKPIHPDAVATMAARGISLDGAFPKHVDTLAGRQFDRVVTLCDRVREVCPSFPGAAAAHWSIPEPSGRPAFDEVAGELTTRITFLLHTLAPVSAS